MNYAPQLEANFRRKKKATADYWRVDETYIKIKGDWHYLYCVVDKYGETIDFMLSKHRDEPAASAFVNKAIGHNGLLKKVVIDKSGANLAALESFNLMLGWEDTDFNSIFFVFYSPLIAVMTCFVSKSILTLHYFAEVQFCKKPNECVIRYRLAHQEFDSL